MEGCQKKFDQAGNILAKASPNTKLSKRYVAANIKGLDAFVKAGTIINNAGFLYVPLMYLSTEELTRLNLIDSLKNTLAQNNNGLANLSSDKFKDLPNVVIVNGFPCLPLEFIS